jgi:hypothetical protein
MLFEINKPSPVPVTDFVANFANNLGIISGSIRSNSKEKRKGFADNLNSKAY